MAHARRKFVALIAASQSTIVVEAIELIARPYDIEREIRDAD